MDVKTFIKSFDKAYREEVAKAANTTEAYLFQLAGGHRLPSAQLSIRLEKASNGLLTRADLRPDIFRYDHEVTPE